jgi:SAM-dependent methyltransferase
MRPQLLSVLACPECSGELRLTGAVEGHEPEIRSGTLVCTACGREYPILDGIPRFVERGNYASSFGLQWTRFRSEQLDSVNGRDLSKRRFFAETEWSADRLPGSWVLDAGCGAGRFLDVLADSGCNVVGMDLSQAVDAAQTNLGSHPNVHLVQADIFKPPFKRGAFDGCFCIGVLQHTPDPLAAVRALPTVVRPGGQVAMTIYERNRWTRLHPKYLLRRFTTRMKPPRLLRLVELVMPVLFPLTDVLFRVPRAGRVFQLAIPVANYVELAELPRGARYRWAVMDTFDMLAPAYDQPQTEVAVTRALREAGVSTVRRTPASGLCLTGTVGAHAVTDRHAARTGP